jgi:hypothetical protein
MLGVVDDTQRRCQHTRHCPPLPAVLHIHIRLVTSSLAGDFPEAAAALGTRQSLAHRRPRVVLQKGATSSLSAYASFLCAQQGYVSTMARLIIKEVEGYSEAEMAQGLHVLYSAHGVPQVQLIVTFAPPFTCIASELHRRRRSVPAADRGVRASYIG